MAAANDAIPSTTPAPTVVSGLPPVEPSPQTAATAAAPPVPPAAAPVPPASPHTTVPPQSSTGHPAAPSRSMSIISMVLGILSLLGFTVATGIPAVILGHMAQRSEPHGRGMWMTGLITGYIGVGLMALLVLLWFLTGLLGGFFF